MRITRRQHGFTLVEMLIIAPIVILVIGAFLTAIIGMTGEVIASRASNALSYNVQDALNRIEQDVKQSSGFLATTPTLKTGGAQGYNDDDATAFTNIGGTSGTSIILNMVATNGNPLSTTTGYVFLKDKPNPCTAAQDNIPLTYTVVYFIKNNTLWRRTIMPDAYADTANTVCATPFQQPSCSPTYMDATATPPFCKTSDIKLVEGLATTDFLVQYYSGEGAGTVNTTASTGAAAARTTALQSATTVSVSIGAKQVAAGRDIERTATLRVSRLDTNASSVATLTVDGAPGAPVPVLKAIPGASVSATWPAVTGATSYTLEYNINGTGWVTKPKSPTDRGADPQNPLVIVAKASEDTVQVRVTATNSVSSTISGITSITLPLWETLILQNSWINYGNSYTSAQYTKTKAGLVIVKGLIHRTDTGAVPDGQLVGSLPVGFRPESGSLLFGTLKSGNLSARIDVSANGNITVVDALYDWFSLDTIAFVPAGYTRNTVTPFMNSYSNWDTSYWAGASYVVDGSGRVATQGLIRFGTNNNGTRIADLPAAALPAEYMHVASRSDGTNGFGDFGIDYRSGLSAFVSKGTGVNYLTLNTIYYPAAASVTWSSMVMQSGWTWYGAPFTAPQYIKSPVDNVVILKGLVKNASATMNTPITTLPVGYRPKERMVRLVDSIDAAARVDIYPTGEVYATAGSNAWFSMDGITFKAEQ